MPQKRKQMFFKKAVTMDEIDTRRSVSDYIAMAM